MFAQRSDPRGEAISYNFYICMNPFIHLLGSSLIQWMIVRINGIEKPKQDSQVRLDGALLSAMPRLSAATPRQSKKCINSCTPTLRRRGVEHNAEIARFGLFHRKFLSKPKPTLPKLKINHKTHLIPTNNISNRIFPTQLRQKGIFIRNPYKKKYSKHEFQTRVPNMNSILSLLVIHTQIVSIP